MKKEDPAGLYNMCGWVCMSKSSRREIMNETGMHNFRDREITFSKYFV